MLWFLHALLYWLRPIVYAVEAMLVLCLVRGDYLAEMMDSGDSVFSV